MKKLKFLWVLFVIPALFIAASLPNLNMDWGSSDCSNSGYAYDAYNGERGCPYGFDFSEYVSCTLYDVDLDNSTSTIEHYLNMPTAEVWYTSSGEIQMYPKDGYGGQGFVVTLDIRAYFDNGNSYEDEWWTCEVTAGSPPYPDPCW